MESSQLALWSSLDYALCIDGDQLLSDLEERAPFKEAISFSLFYPVGIERSLVSCFFWSSESDFGISGDNPTMGQHFDVHCPIQKSKWMGFGTYDSLSSMGFFRNSFKWNHLVVELKKAD